MKLTGENLSTRGKTCPSATLSTTNHTWNDPGSNPGFRGGNNCVSHGTDFAQTATNQSAFLCRCFSKISVKQVVQQCL
jgi:hypothetical protein